MLRLVCGCLGNILEDWQRQGYYLGTYRNALGMPGMALGPLETIFN